MDDSKELALLDEVHKSDLRKNRFGFGAPMILIEEMSQKNAL